MTDLEALVVAAYVFADEYSVPARGGRRPLVSDAELLALAVAQAAIGISSDRQFLGLIGRVLPGWFPHLPDQSQYNRRLRGLVELISIVQQRLARWLDSGGVRLSDGTLISVANYPGCAAAERVRRLRPLRLCEVAAPLRLRRAAGAARPTAAACRSVTPSCPPTRRSTSRSPTFSPAHPLRSLSPTKASGAATTRARLAAGGTTLLTPDKTRTAANLGRERALASTRLVIESVFSNLKEQMRLERHLARTPAGLAVRIAQRILALTLGMLLNTLSGRPARALAAYDGR